MSRKYQLQQKLEQGIATFLTQILNETTLQKMVNIIMNTNSDIILQGAGPIMNRGKFLDNMPFDLDSSDRLEFEHLVGVFSSNRLNTGVVDMSIRQIAYIFGLIRDINATKIIEIGRFKGGTTLIMAAAMPATGKIWSIDIGLKESYLFDNFKVRSFDAQLHDKLKQFNLTNVEILIGDSKTIEFDTDGLVDMIVIDGDHSYEGVKADYERFAHRLRLGGSLLFDDANHDGTFLKSHDAVEQLVQEVLEGKRFKLVKYVDCLAHLERIQ